MINTHKHIMRIRKHSLLNIVYLYTIVSVLHCSMSWLYQTNFVLFMSNEIAFKRHNYADSVIPHEQDC